jgi:hypothetical protein
MSTFCSPFSGHLISSNFCSVLIVFCQFFPHGLHQVMEIYVSHGYCLMTKGVRKNRFLATGFKIFLASFHQTVGTAGPARGKKHV